MPRTSCAIALRAPSVLMVSTAGPYETSIADFWDAFLEEWSHAVAQPVERRTLGHIFRVAEAKYYALNRTLKVGIAPPLPPKCACSILCRRQPPMPTLRFDCARISGASAHVPSYRRLTLSRDYISGA